jgi:hypothetical protein
LNEQDAARVNPAGAHEALVDQELWLQQLP